MLLLLFGSFSLVYSSVAYYSLSRLPSQEFMAWGIFSPSGSLSNYFSGAGANITVGQTLDWHFAITNQMGSIQYVQVVYRLANSTSPNPNATVPAPVRPLLLAPAKVEIPSSVRGESCYNGAEQNAAGEEVGP